jgi:hypothetical protein
MHATITMISLSRPPPQRQHLPTWTFTDLDELHWTGRPGNGSRVMVGAALVGAALVRAVYCLPTWTRTARLIAEHDALREAIGGTPSQRYLKHGGKLREKFSDRVQLHVDLTILATLADAIVRADRQQA